MNEERRRGFLFSPGTAAGTSLVAAAFAAGLGLGYFARPRTASTPSNYEIRAGRGGLTNPLLECEIRDLPPGRELRPFQTLLERTAAELRSAGAVADLSVYFRDLDNGPWLGIQERDLYTPASLLKVPLIIACFRQAEGDPSFLARAIRYDAPAGVPPGSFKPEVRLEVGASYTTEELIRRTASYSDNESMALLAQAVDAGVLARTYADLGIGEEEGADPSRRGAISAYDYGRFFRVLYNASYLDRETSERVLGLFVDSSFSEGLIAGVPPGTKVAHKFGVFWPPEVRPLSIQLHDCGIVYHPQRPYFLCVMTRGGNYQDLKKAIARVSGEVYGEVERQVGAAAVAGAK